MGEFNWSFKEGARFRFFQDWWAESTHVAKNGLNDGPKHINLTTVDIGLYTLPTH